jgi:hypothetical protein
MLIECPECGREVSSRAARCPECAYPMAAETAPLPARGGDNPKGGGGGGGLEVAKQLLGRTVFGGILLASGITYEVPPVIIAAIFTWATCVPIWIKARRAEKLGVGGEVGRVATRLEQQMAELEDRQVQRVAELEDQQERHLGELEERLDFAERLLTTHRAVEPPD